MARNTRRELLLSVDAESDVPLYRQIYDAVRNAVLEGRLHAGDRLPSIRGLSNELRLSHTTVEQAYLQLSVEGYVRNVPRSGYVVEKLDTAYLQLPHTSGFEENVRKAVDDRPQDAFFAENAQGMAVRYDFSYANLWPESFPVKTWRRLVNDVLYAQTAPELARYTASTEPSSLSRALARYLATARGVSCLPEQVIPCAGTGEALALVLSLFDREEHVLGMEEPGFATVHDVAARAGFTMAPLVVGEGADAFVDALRAQNPKIAFMTPSHQFPTGAVLPLDARIEALKWAHENNAYIIEDDSCCEYRYNTAPVPSLHSLDAHHRTIYLGNFSKALSPSLRVAYLVLPPKLLGRYLRLYSSAHPTVSQLDQEVLARFLDEGHFEQHVRRMSQGMKKRHDALLAAMQSEMPQVRLSGVQSGMHLFATVDNGMTQSQLMASALEQGAMIYGTKRMWFSQPGRETDLMIGFSAIKIDDIPPGVAALKRAWFA